jgi:ABC-2 type transport system ATP-binding protein
VSLLGRNPDRPDERTQIRRRLGYLPQEAGFHRGFTVFAFVDYVAILKEMTDRRARHDEVRRVIALTGLESVSGKRIRALSGGMRRRVGLAQALLAIRSCWSSTSRRRASIRSSACGSGR